MTVILHKEKLHMNDLPTACGINVDPYKLPLNLHIKAP